MITAVIRFFQEMKKSFLLHAVAAHFSNGLIPVAVLYLSLFLLSGDLSMGSTVLHLLFIVILFIPVSFFSGIREWKIKYKGAPTPVFRKKIRLSLLLFMLSVASVTLGLSVPDILIQQGPLHWIDLFVLFMMLPVVVLLGHYGGKLSAGQRAASARK
ncbi:MAG: hypothetical protein WCH05_09030 [Chlorobiaceae bacterium]